jgi:hypothetical protein
MILAWKKIISRGRLHILLIQYMLYVYVVGYNIGYHLNVLWRVDPLLGSARNTHLANNTEVFSM